MTAEEYFAMKPGWLMFCPTTRSWYVVGLRIADRLQFYVCNHNPLSRDRPRRPLLWRDQDFRTLRPMERKA